MIQADVFLLLPRCFNHRAVAFDNRHVEKTVGLLLPDFDTRVVDRIHQTIDILWRKASAEISGCRGIGNPLSSQQTKIGFIVASQFKMLKTCSASEDVKRNVQHMIGFRVRHVHFEDAAVAVDAFRQTNLTHHLLHKSKPPTTDGLCSVSKFQRCRRTSQHGRLYEALLVFYSALPPTLLCIQLSS